MNKTEIAEIMFQKLDIKRFEAAAFIDVMLAVISETLLKGDKVVFSSFGALKVIRRKPKKVLNPNDRSAMIIPEQNIVKFFPSRQLKALINQKNKG